VRKLQPMDRVALCEDQVNYDPDRHYRARTALKRSFKQLKLSGALIIGLDVSQSVPNGGALGGLIQNETRNRAGVWFIERGCPKLRCKCAQTSKRQRS
jgi:hypothetical protein